MIAKIHKSSNKIILAVCDSDILGKRFEENGLQLDLSSEFYNGKEESREKISMLIKASSIINFVGKEAVGFAIDEGVVNKENIMRIKGIPHAQCVRM